MVVGHCHRILRRGGSNLCFVSSNKAMVRTKTRYLDDRLRRHFTVSFDYVTEEVIAKTAARSLLAHTLQAVEQ